MLEDILNVYLHLAPLAHLNWPFTVVVLLTRVVELLEPLTLTFVIVGPAACVKVLDVGTPPANVVLPVGDIVTLGDLAAEP